MTMQPFRMTIVLRTQGKGLRVGAARLLLWVATRLLGVEVEARPYVARRHETREAETAPTAAFAAGLRRGHG